MFTLKVLLQGFPVTCKCTIGVKQSEYRLGDTHLGPHACTVHLSFFAESQLEPFSIRDTCSLASNSLPFVVRMVWQLEITCDRFLRPLRLSFVRLFLTAAPTSPQQHAMKTSTSRLRSVFSQLLRRPTTTTTAATAAHTQPLQMRCAHRQAEKVPVIPSPIPFVPDVKTFLTLIGRNLSQHTAKFPTWEALFSLTSPQLKELGIEPPRTRKYLIHWREKYRLGYFGPGGDIVHVQDGKAKLAVEEQEVAPLEVKRRVVNIPADKQIEEVDEEEKIKVERYTAHGTDIAGPYALPAKGGKAAWVTATEGMWEEKRGRKVDGGERRRAEVRFKRRIAERKAEREASGFA